MDSVNEKTGEKTAEKRRLVVNKKADSDKLSAHYY
jgi:hypothetical protein